jgi:putative MFS transporter
MVIDIPGTSLIIAFFLLMDTSIASRVERLPLCGFHRRFVSLVSLGGWFEFFDLFMMAYLGAALQDLHFLTLQQFSHLIAAGFLGMFIGTTGMGLGSDYFGRRTAFIVMLLVYSTFSIAGAFAPDARILILTRFLAGIGIGGEQVVVDTFVSEMVPRRVRGRYVAISQLVEFSAVPAVALVSRLLVPTHWLLPGWRWVMLIGGSGAFFAWSMMFRIPESPRWLESRGRHSEAAQIMNKIEKEVEQDTGKPLPAPPVLAVEQTNRMPFRELWRPAYRSRTIMLIVFHLLQTVGFYGFANWAPTFLLKEGKNLGQSLNYGFLIALVSPIGPLLGVTTTERLERKRALVMLSLLMAGTGLAFALASRAITIVLIGATMTIFSSWFSSVFHAYQAELFPTRARGTGVGFTYGWSRMSAVFSTLIIGALLAHGVLAVFIFIASAMVGVALVVGVWGPRTNAVALEDISH